MLSELEHLMAPVFILFPQDLTQMYPLLLHVVSLARQTRTLPFLVRKLNSGGATLPNSLPGIKQLCLTSI